MGENERSPKNFTALRATDDERESRPPIPREQPNLEPSSEEESLLLRELMVAVSFMDFPQHPMGTKRE
jgi:hypothetical protein